MRFASTFPALGLSALALLGVTGCGPSEVPRPNLAARQAAEPSLDAAPRDTDAAAPPGPTDPTAPPAPAAPADAHVPLLADADSLGDASSDAASCGAPAEDAGTFTTETHKIDEIGAMDTCNLRVDMECDYFQVVRDARGCVADLQRDPPDAAGWAPLTRAYRDCFVGELRGACDPCAAETSTRLYYSCTIL